MSEDKEKRYLYIDGQKVPVSEQIYKTYWEYTEKERYFMGKPKQEKKVGTFVPPHELLNAEANPSAYGKDITVAEMLTILLLDYAPRKWKPNVAARHAARIDAYIVPLIGKEKLSTLTPKRLERFFLEVQELPQIGNPSKKVSLCVVGKIKSLFMPLSE